MMDGDIFRVTIPLDDEVPAAGENVPVTEQVTEQVTTQVTTQVTEQVAPQVIRLLRVLEETGLSTKEILGKLDLRHRPTLVSDYIKPAIELGLIEMTQPDSPKSPTQKYRLTEKGITFKKSMEQS